MHILNSSLTRTASGSLNSLRKSSSWVLEQQIFKLSEPNSRTRCGQTCWTSCNDSESAGTENQKKDVTHQTFFVGGYWAIFQLGNTNKLVCWNEQKIPKGGPNLKCYAKQTALAYFVWQQLLEQKLAKLSSRRLWNGWRGLLPKLRLADRNIS